MKYLSVLLLLASHGVYAITPLDTHYKREMVTLDYLLESCTVVGETANGMIAHFDCESYLYGVLDSYLAIREQIPVKQRACFPVDIAPWQVYALLQKQPSFNNQQAPVTVIIDLLRKQYPCHR